MFQKYKQHAVHLRLHDIGMLVLFLHDISDVILEITKINAYLKKRNGKTYAIHEWIANASFIAFAISWYVSIVLNGLV